MESDLNETWVKQKTPIWSRDPGDRIQELTNRA